MHGLFACVGPGPSSVPRALRQALALERRRPRTPLCSANGRRRTIRGNAYGNIHEVFELPSCGASSPRPSASPAPAVPARRAARLDRMQAWLRHNTAFAARPVYVCSGIDPEDRAAVFAVLPGVSTGCSCAGSASDPVRRHGWWRPPAARACRAARRQFGSAGERLRVGRERVHGVEAAGSRGLRGVPAERPFGAAGATAFSGTPAAPSVPLSADCPADRSFR